MKHPWIVFMTLCSIVLGIVIFCVIFGGYSSLVRSQNRINEAKQLLSDQCTRQIDLALDLASAQNSEDFSKTALDLTENAKTLQSVLSQMAEGKTPMTPEVVAEFQAVENRMAELFSQAIALIRSDVPSPDPEILDKKAGEMKTDIQQMIRQYNKEARYFNTRCRVFPVSYAARLFGLDQLHFPEIEIPENLSGESTHAS